MSFSKLAPRAKHLRNTPQDFGALMAHHHVQPVPQRVLTQISSQTAHFRVWAVYLRRSAMIPAL